MRALFSDYGMVLMLLVLCVFFSIMTLKEQDVQGEDAAQQLLPLVEQNCNQDELVVIAASQKPESEPTVAAVADIVQAAGFSHVFQARGTPRTVRTALEELHTSGRIPGVIIRTGEAISWRLWQILPEKLPKFTGVPLINPENYYWPDFLKSSNLLAVVDRIVVIAIIAIGMTMVIITGGIDLSVGSLIALSAVISTTVMKALGGGEAPAWTVAAGFCAGILSCGLLGAFGGALVAHLKIAPFITTLAFMMVARGLAFLITGGFSIYQVPNALPWLGQGRSFGIPNTVILLVILYVIAAVFMAHTKLARYIYAVGGNEEAARLSGVPVKRVIIFVYMASSVVAGIGGCLQASQLNTGTPTCGQMYEMYVIAAVVVGGTSLSGGSGRILGTLIGAFIISVIQNGMNLLNLESYTQTVVLGLVILGAVLLDKLRGTISFTFFNKNKIRKRS